MYTWTQGPQGLVAHSMVTARSGILVKYSPENCLPLRLTLPAVTTGVTCFAHSTSITMDVRY